MQHTTRATALALGLALLIVPVSSRADEAHGDYAYSMDDGGMADGRPKMHSMMGRHGESMGGGSSMASMPMMDPVGMMDMMRQMRLVAHLDLTADQRKQIELLKLQHQKDAAALMARAQSAGVELQRLQLAGSPDPEKLKAAVKDKHAAMEQLENDHLALLQKVRELLTAPQRQQLEEMLLKPMGHPPVGKGPGDKGPPKGGMMHPGPKVGPP